MRHFTVEHPYLSGWQSAVREVANQGKLNPQHKDLMIVAIDEAIKHVMRNRVPVKPTSSPKGLELAHRALIYSVV